MVTQAEKANILKHFREMTGYSLRDCKEALEETNWDVLSATNLLRQKYASKYQNLEIEDDACTEKAVGIFRYGDCDFAYCEFAAKSDIVIRSEQLKSLMGTMFQILSSHLIESADLAFFQTYESFQQQFEEVLTYFREPIKLLSAGRKVLTENEVLGIYLHNILYRTCLVEYSSEINERSGDK